MSKCSIYIGGGSHVFRYAVSLFLGFKGSLTRDTFLDTKFLYNQGFLSLPLLIRIYGRLRPCFPVTADNTQAFDNWQ